MCTEWMLACPALPGESLRGHYAPAIASCSGIHSARLTRPAAVSALQASVLTDRAMTCQAANFPSPSPNRLWLSHSRDEPAELLSKPCAPIANATGCQACISTHCSRVRKCALMPHIARRPRVMYLCHAGCSLDKTSTRDPWPPAGQPSRASERTRTVSPDWTLRGFSGWPFGERRWSRSARRSYLICLFIGQRAGTRAVTSPAWRAAMTRWAYGGAGHDHLRVVWRCGPAYQIRTRVAGSSHNSSAAPTSNAP